MNKATKTQWLAALRSGEYKQCRGVLYDEVLNGYCCIGVLGKVLGHTDTELMNGACGNWRILGGLDPVLAENLEEMNDKGKRFKIIAKYIEENVEASE